MIKIKGIELDETFSLTDNLQAVEDELSKRYSFWFSFQKGIEEFEKSNKSGKAGFVFKTLLFITLFPEYIFHLLNAPKLEKITKEAKHELVSYYDLPETKVKRFKLQCINEKAIYQSDLEEINQEIEKLKKNQEHNFLNKNTKQELQDLINGYQEKKNKKLAKLSFYEDAANRLSEIEKQIEVKKSLAISKQKFNELVEDTEDPETHSEMKKEFDLYDFYGEILEELNTSFKKIEEDSEEEIPALELKEILSQINKINI